MKSQFDTLCRDLNLDRAAPCAADLEKWYFEYVSKDRCFGNVADWVRDYLDVFLPNFQENKAVRVSALQDMNAIQYAAAHGYDRFLDRLDDSIGELINHPVPKTGMTPLHLAAHYGHVHAVNVLLKRGADPLRQNNVNQLPIQSALFTPGFVDEHFHKRKTCIFNALKSAAPNTLCVQDRDQRSLAHTIAVNGYTELMANLIDECPLAVSMPDMFRKYPIHVALLNNKLEIVKLLLSVPGVADLKDSNLCVALHYAAGDESLLEACFPYYPEVDIPDAYNKTPLLHAVEAKHLPSLIALLEQGADIQSAVDYVIDAGDEELVQWILDNLPQVNHIR